MLIPCSEQEEKVNRIYETYKRLMLYAAYQILGNSEDAEDALQMARCSESAETLCRLI